MMRSPFPAARRASAAALTAALVAGGALVAPAAAAAADDPVVTTADLVDASDAQQRWLSVPNSRIVLNPFDGDRDGSELDQTAGPNLPLHLGYYASDEALRMPGLIETYATSGERAEGGGYRQAFAESFDDASDWDARGVATTSEAGITTVTLSEDRGWGHIARTIEVDDVADTRFLTVDVASLGEETSWNVKVADESGSDLPDLQPDSTEAGEATFDLADAYGWEEGPRTLTIKIYAVSDEGTAGSLDVRSLSLDNGADAPWERDDDALVDDFSDASAWSAAADNGRSATLVSDGAQGTVRLGDDAFGAVERSVTVDLDEAPLLSVRVAETSGEWALKVRTEDGGDVELQSDTSRTGLTTVDLADATGWSGEQTFLVKLFHIGADGYTAFDDLAFHAGGTWLDEAESYDNSWTPEALESHGDYADGGTIDVVDAFHDEDAFSRTVTATTDGAALAGSFTGSASWDAERSLLTVEEEFHTYAIAMPHDAEVRFGASVAGLSVSEGEARPLAGDGAWTAELTDGEQVVGVGLAANAPEMTDDAAADAQERALAAAADPAGDRAAWAGFWDDYLTRIPQIEDFSVQRVADGDVTVDEMRHFWFSAWINLEMNVLPATPETGNEFAQLGTGKPSMWMNGTPGTKNVASWDSLLGMQQLVYVDPENAWESFQGMMALVEDGPDATEPSDTEYGTRGELGGESLPSRKAQTAWILYSVTGEKDRLESIYEPLALHLNWERYNMRWVLGENNHFDERDSEFVTSLAYDLEFAIRIAEELGHDEDVAEYEAVISEISESYSEWFFPKGADDDGKVWDTVQKVYLDETRDEPPFGDDTEGEPFRNENGQWVRAGFSFYTSTAFVMDELADESMVKTMDRFVGDYDETAQLAGLGDFAVKAPDIQLITYGLLDMDPIEGSPEPELRDRATVLVNTFLRDMVRSGWFAEVYYADGEPGDPVGARGVRPSLFGISNYIDFVLMSNGVRTDEGDPTFVRLAGATGGVSGLTYRGEALDVDIDGGTLRFSGAAAEGVCDAIDVAEGQTVTWAADCADAEEPGDPGDDAEDGGAGSDDADAGSEDGGSAGDADGGEEGAADAGADPAVPGDADASGSGDAEADGGADAAEPLPATGAENAGAVLALLIALALAGGGALLLRRRAARG
ncbi:LPXTG cell wall anchor domain-containing protein [Microbacterium sp. gxy059]|uniref:LPXTG cell wall anchor domain-containing protein n=1 Tax=Microbacterium sp. gxy059 TaxID=2957199 RepID=UPI003D9838D1